MGNSSGDLREFLRKCRGFKETDCTENNSKNLTEEPEEYRDARRKGHASLRTYGSDGEGIEREIAPGGIYQSGG